MILVKPPVLVNSNTFKIYNGEDASKQIAFNLSNISPDNIVTLTIKDISGEVVIGEYDLNLRAFILKE